MTEHLQNSEQKRGDDNIMQKKSNSLRDVIVVGFALFSMFFGAGNVVFPPYLGMEAGPQWLAGFSAYFIADIGLALLGMFALLRVGSSEADLNDNLQHLMASGIRNIMCLRGDINPELPLHKDFLHASDLAAYIQKHYGCFGLSGACYPQHHPEAASLLEDVQNLKIKEEAGVTHLVSQLFFDNTYYYRFTNLARKIGVTSPISVGVMPIAKKVHIKNVVQLSGATIPTRFGALLNKWQDDPDGLFKAGTDYAIEQCRDMMECGADGIHIYAMNNLDVVSRVYEGIKDLL